MADPDAPLAAAEISLPPTEEFTGLTDEQLRQLVQMVESAERRIREQMAPFQLRLTRLAKDAAAVHTEVRRRERQRHIQSRKEVREQVKEGDAPSLAQLIEAEALPSFGEPAFSELSFLLESGGQVALGYPGSRTPSLQMTDGSAISTVTTLAEARELYRQGWEIGVPAKRGVRVHTPGTRLERLLDPENCFVRPAAGASGPDGASA
ncbi:MAG TPA: hypothetical protein VMW80_11855 [Candidatus Dormibacteraeota bacterium]|nr:hypothetical protein [Candidatus Dormibacteraeota bacterium]